MQVTGFMAAGIEAQLNELGINLTALPQPGDNDIPARTASQIAYLAGAGRTIPALPRNALVELQMTVEV